MPNSKHHLWSNIMANVHKHEVVMLKQRTPLMDRAWVWCLSLSLTPNLMRNWIPCLNTHPRSIGNHIKTQSVLQGNVLMQKMRDLRSLLVYPSLPNPQITPILTCHKPFCHHAIVVSTCSLLNNQMLNGIETALSRWEGDKVLHCQRSAEVQYYLYHYGAHHTS